MDETTAEILERMEQTAKLEIHPHHSFTAQHLADIQEIKRRLLEAGLIESPILRVFMDRLKDRLEKQREGEADGRE